jgi:hypothetical protein
MTNELVDMIHFETWLGVLASPRIYAILRRIPSKEHLLNLLDAYMPYAHSKRLYTLVPHGKPRPDISQRGPLADRFREILLRWEPPEVTQELREAARALFEAGGSDPPEPGWDELEWNGPPSLEESLIWPEGRWDEATMAPDEEEPSSSNT